MSVNEPAPCRALLVSAPASGQGKTTATAALARWYRQQGQRVRVFKTGPDFLDPMVLEVASGAPVHQLDLWMGGEAHCRTLLWQAARECDVILIEGAMGLFDGASSTADLAIKLGVPVLAVIDASGMVQTFGAVAHGLAHYRPGLQLAGVLANRVGSDSHARLLRDSLPPDLEWFGALPRDEGMALPSRHLGLVQAEEVADLDARLDRAAEALGRLTPAWPRHAAFFEAPGSVAHGLYAADASNATDATDAQCESPPERLQHALQGVTIAVAHDAAFAFLYRANTQTLRDMGAHVITFSPLKSDALPDCDALYLPGGYPELHAARLSAHTALRDAIHAHHAQGKPIVAECGGMLALLDTLAPHGGEPVPMWGLIKGAAALQSRLVNLGMHAIQMPSGVVRGHTFHHADMRTDMPVAAWTQPQRVQGRPEAVYRVGRLHASFLHMYFPSNPAAVAALFSRS